MLSAMRISGNSGQYSFINGTYEPMHVDHNQHSVWVMRSGWVPRYLFHSGKRRWVISSRLDDGARCWAFVQAGEKTSVPSDCDGPWTCCRQDDGWISDSMVLCQAVAPSADKFVQLRLSLEPDMRQLGLIEQSSLKQLWRRLDYSGAGVVTLEDFDKLVGDLVCGGVWPMWLHNKPAMTRAYKNTILKDGDNGGSLEKRHFHALLFNLYWYSRLWDVFKLGDSCGDRCIDEREFAVGMKRLGLELSEHELDLEMSEIDMLGRGHVLFLELCSYIREAEVDADVTGAMQGVGSLRGRYADKLALNVSFKTKCLQDFDQVEVWIKAMCHDDRHICRLWEHLDTSGKSQLSLATIDKFAAEEFPPLNHLPALTAAYRKTISGRAPDGRVQRKELKALIGNLFYFNKLYWLFDQVESDERRITYQEFKWCIALCRGPLPKGDARRNFASMDRSSTGTVFFDDFCAFFSSIALPEATKALVG